MDVVVVVVVVVLFVLILFILLIDYTSVVAYNSTAVRNRYIV